MAHEILTAVRGQDSGARFSMRGRTAVAARGGHADILLSDSAVGNGRLVFTLRNGRLWLHADRGTPFLNGRALPGPAPLRGGDHISFGPAAYEVLWAGPAAPAPRAGSVAFREAEPAPEPVAPPARESVAEEAPPREPRRTVTGTATAGLSLIAAAVAGAALMADFTLPPGRSVRIWDAGIDAQALVAVPVIVGLLAAFRWSMVSGRRPRRSRLLALVVMVCGGMLFGAAVGFATPALGTETGVLDFFGREAGPGFWGLAGAGLAMIALSVVGRRGGHESFGRVQPELMAAVLVAAGGAFGAAAAAAGAGLTWVSVGAEAYGGFGQVVVAGRFVLPAAFVLLALAIGCLTLVATPFARAARPFSAGVAVMGAAITGLALGWAAGIPLSTGTSLGPGIALAVIGGVAAIIGGVAGSFSFEILDPLDEEELAS